MPRSKRTVFEGALYHVYSRGHRDDPILGQAVRKQYFLVLLERGIRKFNVHVYAFCIMDSHYHLFICTPDANLPALMHFLGSSYAAYLQRTHGYYGHIFAGRYSARLVERDEYLLNLSRYIHLNPVRSGAVARPEQYEWSSYRCLTGLGIDYLRMVDTTLLEFFGETGEAAASRFRDFVESGIGDPACEEEAADFDRLIMNAPEHGGDLKGSIKLSALLEGVLSLYALPDLRSESGRATGVLKTARLVFAHMAKQYTTATNREIAELCGGISISAISHLHVKAETEDASVSGIRHLIQLWGLTPIELINSIGVRPHN